MEIVKQPNGSYALFVRNDLDFSHINLTEEEVFEHHTCAFLWKDTTSWGFVKKMREAEGRGVQFWNVCLALIKVVHGRKRYQEILDMIANEGEM